MKSIDNKKRRLNPKQPEEESLSIDATKLPEYKKFLSHIEQVKAERIEKVHQLKGVELEAVHNWTIAQKKQAWDDYYSTQSKIRSDLIEEIQKKIRILKQEKDALNNQLKEQVNYKDWIPEDRLNTISSFVGGATTEEINHDLMYAKQTTPNLVYSDYDEYKSDTVEDSPTSRQSTTEYHHYENGWWPTA